MRMSILAILPLAALAACTSAETPPPSAAAMSGDYAQMSCAELEAAARSAASDASWARRQQQQTFGSGNSDNVSINVPIGGGGGVTTGPRPSSSRQRADISQAMAAKGCS